jgi:hypothetical protein
MLSGADYLIQEMALVDEQLLQHIPSPGIRTPAAWCPDPQGAVNYLKTLLS